MNTHMLVTQLGIENDRARMNVSLIPQAMVSVEFSPGVEAQRKQAVLLKAVKAFNDFGPLDVERDLGRFQHDGEWYVFAIVYRDRAQTRPGDPQEEPVHRAIHIMCLSELSHYSPV